MKQICLLFFSLLSISSLGAAALTYDPAVVNLEGTLELQAFPGPPSYESIRDGDEIERHFYLRLNLPIDVVPSGQHPGVENPELERKVKIMQLSIGEEDEALWSKFRQAGPGKRVKVRGKLFHRFNGHHHSRVLLEVMSMEPLT